MVISENLTLCALIFGASAGVTSRLWPSADRIEGKSLVLTDDAGVPYLEAGQGKDGSTLTLRTGGKMAVAVQASPKGSSVALHNADGKEVAALAVQGSVASVTLNDELGQNGVVLRVDDTGRTITVFDPRRQTAIVLLSIEDSALMRVEQNGGPLVDLSADGRGAGVSLTSGRGKPSLMLSAAGATDASMRVVGANGRPRVEVGVVRDEVVGATAK